MFRSVQRNHISYISLERVSYDLSNGIIHFSVRNKQHLSSVIILQVFSHFNEKVML